MYQVSEAVYELLKSRARSVEWEGTITLSDNTVVNFNRSNIAEGTGAINLSCAPNNSITWGNAYLGELALSYKDLSVDRSMLQNAIVGVAFRVTGDEPLTWGIAKSMTWDEIGIQKWGSLVLSKPIPMGLYKIEEAMRTYGSVKVTAYDFMRKFDKNVEDLDTTARTPHRWLDLACTTCGVTYGMTSQQIFAFPNGRRLVKFANSDSSIKTWRDLISAVCAMIGGNACISRTGSLVVRPYNNIIVDAIDASGRYSSDFSDYQSYYTGLYLTYKEGGVQEYVTNDEQHDTGLAFDLKSNPFMQISDDGEREEMMQALIDRQAGLVYTPFNLTGPLNPLYDLMDTLIFTGNHAENAVAPITNLTYRIGGEMSLSCGGENPALATAESRESKALSGLSTSSYHEDLWMRMENAPASNTTIQANADTQIGILYFNATEENTMIHVAYTAYYVLAKTALVIGKVYVDNTLIYTVKQNQLLGENKFTITTGYVLTGKGSHSARVMLRLEESTIDIGGGGILTDLNVVQNGVYAPADFGVYGFSQVTAEVGDGLGYQGAVQTVEYTAPEAQASYSTNLQYTAAAEDVTE